jgi:xyloglucan-specific exo-beta-1,4-glucanase
MKKLRKSVLKFVICLTVITSMFSVSPSTPAYASETYTWNNVKIVGGGYVPGIIFNATQKDLIYARTDIGGAYRWNPANNTWIPLNDSVGFADWNKNGVDALATDPVEPNRVYMATGTYTGDLNNWDTNGQIMRSTDYGNTWLVTPLPFKVGGNMPGRGMGERLVIDPNKNNILYFGARSGNGLWKSTDYGATWSKVTGFTATGTYITFPGQEYGSDPIGLAWITFDPRTGSAGNATQTIYVGVAETTGESVYRSTDGGATWAAVPGQPIGFIPHHGVLSSNGKLYISYSNGAGPYDGSSGDVWKFDTATGVWTMISPVPSTDTSNCYYGYGGLAVDAQHPDTIMVATLNSWWPDAIIFRSTDGGTTWTRIWDWARYPSRTLRYTQDISAAPWLTMGLTSGGARDPVPVPKLGWMIGDLEIDPFNSDRMIYGTGATIYGTNNLSAWDTGGKINLSVMAQGIEETAVLSLISLPTGTARLLSGLGDIGGFKHDDLTIVPKLMYTTPLFVTTTSMDYAELNPSFIVRVGNVDRENSNNLSLGYSIDGGITWTQTPTEPTGTTGGGKVAVAADASVLVWSAQGATSVCYSSNKGRSWTPCSGLPLGATVISDRVNPKKFYAYNAGNFYISANGGATFTLTGATGLPTNTGLNSDQGVFNLKAMPGREGDIWCAGGNAAEGKYGIWHSTDSGANFTKLANVQEADVIGFGKAAPGQNYMALYTSAKINNVRGVFRSDDAGATWVRINDDQHQYARINMCITGDPTIYGRVYVGTNGRGIVYGDMGL